METKKKRPWFKFKIGWSIKPLWQSAGKSAVRDNIVKYVKDRMLDPLVKYSRGKIKLWRLKKGTDYHLELKRDRRYRKLDIQSPGTLRVKRSNKTIMKCKTLELPWKDNQVNISCIPYGTYNVKKRHSKKFKLHFHVLRVPRRTYILIHSGNYVSDVEGCILVGDSFTDINNDGLRDVTNSKKTLEKLLNFMPDNFIINIK